MNMNKSIGKDMETGSRNSKDTAKDSGNLPRLPNPSSSSPSSTVETNVMSRKPPTSTAPLALSSSSLSISSRQSRQGSPNPGELQPYCPPPPSDTTSSPSHHQHLSTKNSTPSTASSNTGTIPSKKQTGISMTTGPTTALAANRGRRHSSAANTLSIQTKQLNSIKKGPNTADVESGAGVGTGSRYLDPDLIVQGTARKHLKSIKQPLSISAPNLPPRQSPNHLAIPHPSRNSPFSQNQHQYQSQQPNHGLAQYQRHEQSKSQHQNQRAHSHNHHQQQQQQQHQQHHQDPVPHSPNSPRATSPSGIGLSHALQDRTAMALMQRYLIQPDDPDSEADIAMQILISQAAVDSKGFEILVPQTVESIKRHHATLSSRIAALTARLSLESKIAEAAQSLLKLHADNKKLARQASNHLEAANRKVDQVATELWKLTQLAADLQRTLLQHTSGVLALGVVRLEDQSRRERELHALQVQEAAIDQDAEKQLESMSKTIMSLESDALEAQSLLEDKDRAIERLVKQLEHQRDLFIKLDEQQQKTMALSRSQQRDMDALSNDENKDAPEVDGFLAAVGKRLQMILQQQQKQQEQQKQHRKYRTQEKDCSDQSMDAHSDTTLQRDRTAQTWPSDTTLLSGMSISKQNQDPSSLAPVHEDSISSVPSDGNFTGTATATLSETVASSKPCSVSASNSNMTATTVPSPKYSMDRINTTLDALENHVSESQQKMQVLEGELGLLRRQSVVLSESRNNSIRIKSVPSSTRTQAEDTIRAALEKSLKDALLEKELARQELENERQRWQEDQNHRIRALEESLIAAEDSGKSGENDIVIKSKGSQASEETVQTLTQQLREAIEEIDTLSQQQQSSLKSMRQLFDLVPNSRRKSHYQLLTSYHQAQQQIASSASPNGTIGGGGELGSGRNSPVGSVSSFTSSGAVGFNMEALMSRIKELVTRSQQLEQDNLDLKQQLGLPDLKCRKTRSQSPLLHSPTQPSQHLEQLSNDGNEAHSCSPSQLKEQQLELTHSEDPPQPDSVWISKSELERLQASAGMIQLLEKELDLLKQHTDMLLDENARLADLAAANVTGVSSPSNRQSNFGGLIKKPMTRNDALEELQEIIRVKDKLLQDQERSLQQVRDDLAKVTQRKGADAAFSLAPSPSMSSFDVKELDGYRVKCSKLEEEVGEMRMTIAALESVHGGPGSGTQLLKALSVSSLNAQFPPSTSWLTSSLNAVGSLNFGSMSHHNSSDIHSGISSPIPSSVEAFYNNQQAADGSTNSLTPSGSSDYSGGGGQLNGNAAVAGATAALRKEFRRVMSELRDEKEKAVRKEVDERRRLERTVRQLRRELQAVQSSVHA
ncbi:hypothetical protein BGZ51_000320 [Haplosporangium sp. Z 767]|nr:hypothetical protein BGZ51_000320 [Haplosporangium sp. Z 767]